MNPDREIIEIRPGTLKRWVLPLSVIAASAVLLLVVISFVVHQKLRIGLLHPLIVALLIPIIYWKAKPILTTPAVTYILSPDGLLDCSIPGKGVIPWTDIERIGFVDHDWFGKTPAIQLRSTETFSKSLTPQGYAKITPRLEAWRKACDFDYCFPWVLLDRSTTDFFVLLCSYWHRYGHEPETIEENESLPPLDEAAKKTP